jgi:uncharacterized protein (TIGR04255 family)
MANNNPLIASPPEEVPLKEAPIVRVIAQVRFPPILSMKEISFVAPFQEAIRDIYPILRPEKSPAFILGSQGFEPTEPIMVWRFIDIDGNWRVSLTPEFISLETTCYSSRNDFLKRFENILTALNTHIKPQVIERLGLRYIDQLKGEDLTQLSSLIRPEISGVLATELDGNVLQSINESLFTIPEKNSQMLARWGRLPANVTIDPSAIEPITEASWVLDTDIFRQESQMFNVELILEETRQFAERIYTFFRWAVTDEFLERFGGSKDYEPS